MPTRCQVHHRPEVDGVKAHVFSAALPPGRAPPANGRCPFACVLCLGLKPTMSCCATYIFSVSRKPKGPTRLDTGATSGRIECDLLSAI
jgi:hypothetical protein